MPVDVVRFYNSLPWAIVIVVFLGVLRTIAHIREQKRTAEETVVTKPFNVGIATSITILYFMVEAVFEAGVGALASDWLPFATVEQRRSTVVPNVARNPSDSGPRCCSAM